MYNSWLRQWGIALSGDEVEVSVTVVKTGSEQDLTTMSFWYENTTCAVAGAGASPGYRSFSPQMDQLEWMGDAMNPAYLRITKNG